MYQRIDADYYGYRDDDDGLLEKLEAEAEAVGKCQACDDLSLVAISRTIEEWNRIQKEKYGSLAACPYLPKSEANQKELNKSHIHLPTQEEIEQELLRKRKEEMLKRYLM